MLSYDGSAAAGEFAVLCSDPSGGEIGGTDGVLGTCVGMSVIGSGGKSTGNCGAGGTAGKSGEKDGNSGADGAAGKSANTALEVDVPEKSQVGNVGGSSEYGGGEYPGAVGNDMLED